MNRKTRHKAKRKARRKALSIARLEEKRRNRGKGQLPVLVKELSKVEDRINQERVIMELKGSSEADKFYEVYDLEVGRRMIKNRIKSIKETAEK